MLDLIVLLIHVQSLQLFSHLEIVDRSSMVIISEQTTEILTNFCALLANSDHFSINVRIYKKQNNPFFII